MMDDVTPLPSSDSEMTSKEKKNCRARFKIQMKIHFLSIKAEDDALFKNRLRICPCNNSIKVHAQKCSG